LAEREGRKLAMTEGSRIGRKEVVREGSDGWEGREDVSREVGMKLASSKECGWQVGREEVSR